MKPIIIIKETNKDGKFEFTEKELKELIGQAYEQGFEDGRRNTNFPLNITHDMHGNPIPYRISTESDPKDNIVVPNTKYNDLVYRGWEYNDKFPKQGEPIPCYDTPVSCGTSGQPNPTTKLNSTSVSTVV